MTQQPNRRVKQHAITVGCLCCCSLPSRKLYFSTEKHQYGMCTYWMARPISVEISKSHTHTYTSTHREERRTHSRQEQNCSVRRRKATSIKDTTRAVCTFKEGKKEGTQHWCVACYEETPKQPRAGKGEVYGHGFCAFSPHHTTPHHHTGLNTQHRREKGRRHSHRRLEAILSSSSEARTRRRRLSYRSPRLLSRLRTSPPVNKLVAFSMLHEHRRTKKTNKMNVSLE